MIYTNRDSYQYHNFIVKEKQTSFLVPLSTKHRQPFVNQMYRETSNIRRTSEDN